MLNLFTISILSEQFYYAISPQDRFHGICRLLDMFSDKPKVVFCRTKRDVDYLTDKLDLLNYKVTGYHGDLTSNAREKSLQKFSNGDVDTLLLTDTPAEIDGLKHVGLVLFSMIPQDPDSYIQRILRLEAMFSIEEIATLITPNEFKKLSFIQRITKSDILQKAFVSIDDIIAQKKDVLVNDLLATSDSAMTENEREFVDQILSKVDPRVAIYGLIKQGYFRSFNSEYYKQLSQSSGSVLSQGSDRLFIALGKADGIDPDTLVDFLQKETSIGREFFSEIKIFDTFSFFVVPSSDADVILKFLDEKNAVNARL